MKKLFFGMAITFAAITINAQELRNADGKTSTPAANNVSRELVKNEQAENLTMRITRVLGLDAETSKQIGVAANDYYTKTSTGKNTDAAKKEREEKFKTILGAEKYQNLTDYRAKLKANWEQIENTRKADVEKVLLD